MYTQNIIIDQLSESGSPVKWQPSGCGECHTVLLEYQLLVGAGSCPQQAVAGCTVLHGNHCQKVFWRGMEYGTGVGIGAVQL